MRYHYPDDGPGDTAAVCGLPGYLFDVAFVTDWARVDCTGCLRVRGRAGEAVRDIWCRWASRQPAAKPSWLREWDELDPADPDDAGQREVDMLIGWTIAERARREVRERIARFFDSAAAAARRQGRPLDLLQAADYEYAARVIRGGAPDMAAIDQEAVRQVRAALADLGYAQTSIDNFLELAMKDGHCYVKGHTVSYADGRFTLEPREPWKASGS